MPEGLLVHLVDRFAEGRERVVVEALAYLERERPVVRAALDALAGTGGQVVVEDAAGIAAGPGEGGDWLERLCRLAPGSAMLWLCPARMVDLLCGELSSRVQYEGLAVDRFAPDGTGMRVLATAWERHLLVTTWSALIRRVRSGIDAAAAGGVSVGGASVGGSAAGAAGAGAVLARELAELELLARRMELPPVSWTAEELDRGLTRHTFRRAVHSAELLFDVLDDLPCASRRGTPRWTDRGGVAYRARYRVGAVDVFFGFDPERWGPGTPTPLTFGIWSPDLRPGLRAKAHQAYAQSVGAGWRSGGPGGGSGGGAGGGTLELRGAGQPPGAVRAFEPLPESAAWWWGPVPLPGGAPAHRTRPALHAAVAPLLEALAGLD